MKYIRMKITTTSSGYDGMYIRQWFVVCLVAFMAVLTIVSFFCGVLI